MMPSSLTSQLPAVPHKGTAIHQMVQNQLTEAGVATRIEALVSEPREHIRSYVDVMIKDSQGKEMPLEIKSISAEGFANLNSPKWAHRIQLNAYLAVMGANQDRKSTRLNSSHVVISYAVFCLKKKI